MPQRALLYRRPSEPQAIEIIFGRAVYLVRLRRHRQARRYTLRIQSATREAILTIPPRGTLKEGECLLCVASRAPHIDRRIGDFLRREAKRDLEIASRHFATELGVEIKRVAVRDQASRWGSCSTTGMLSFSWRLILAPSMVLNYLAAHEVAHLVEMNHSARFWRLVQRVCPYHDRAKSWLDVHGTDLHRYGLPELNHQAP